MRAQLLMRLLLLIMRLLLLPAGPCCPTELDLTTTEDTSCASVSLMAICSLMSR